jgi:glycosyltransferase involved in cell wall biosynthesis
VRILQVIPGVRGAGGAERSLAAAAPFLSRDVELHIATLTGRNDLGAQLEDAGATLHDLGPAGRVVLVRRLIRLVRQIRPDLVHTTLIDADLVGRVAAFVTRTPVVTSLVATNHSFGAGESHGGHPAKRLGVWGADAVTARTVVAFHALTDHVAVTMGRRLLVPRRRMTVIARGRSDDQLGRRTPTRRLLAREALGVGSDETLVVAAARHEHPKGLDLYIGACAELAALRPGRYVFLLGGREGRDSEHLRRLAREHADAAPIRFIGQRDDLPDIMCAADLWVVPSRREGLGSILIELMALEVPVVAAGVPAIAEVAGEPPVFRLAEPGSSHALALTMVDALDHPDTTMSLTQRARERYLGSFQAEAVSVAMVDFYRQALQRSRWTRGSAS